MTHKLAYLCGSKSWGGLEMNQLRNACWMQERGHQVVFFCWKDSPLAEEAQKSGLAVVLLPHYRKYYDFKNGKRLCRELKQGNFTHLLIRSTYDMSIAAFCKSRLGKSIHLSYFMEMQLGVRKTNLLHTLRFRKIDLWSCPLPFLAKQVETMTRFPKERICIIPSGLKLADLQISDTQAETRTRLDLPRETFLFGLIGRFDPQKGQLLLLEALVKAKNTNFGVVLLGEPTKNEGETYSQQILDFIRENQLEERVFIRGFRKDIATFYRAIDCFVMASKAETFGMVTIEAMACGTPTLGSNAGGTPEILEHGKTGSLFHTLDAADLARKLDEISSGQIHIPAELLQESAARYDYRKICSAVEKKLGLITH